MRRQPREEARRARNDVYRQHILEAAERIFAEHGFEAAKVQHISKLAGLSMGTIYAVFPSKTDIFRRGIAKGIFVDEDPLYLSKMFSVMDQVLLSDWVAGGMKEDRDTLIRRLQDMAERAFSRPAGSGRVSAARSA